MARDYSTSRFRCGWCRKLLKGYVPKGGDGSGFLIPKHKDSAGQRCRGSYDLRDIGDIEREVR